MKIFEGVPKIFISDRKITTKIARLDIAHCWKNDEFCKTMESVFDFVSKMQETKRLPEIQNVYKELKNETGLQKALIDEDLGKGFVFGSGNSNLMFFSNKEKKKYFLGEQSTLNGKLEQYITVDSNRGEIINSLSNYSKSKSAEDFVDSVLDRIDLSFLKLRKFVNSQSASECMSNINKANLQINAKAPEKPQIVRNNGGILNPEQFGIAENIKNMFGAVYTTLNSISNIVTRHHVKNAYYQIKHGLRGTRLIEFENLQGRAKGLVVNRVSDHDKKCLILRLTPHDGSERNIIINESGFAMKHKTIPGISNTGNRTEYYTQSEIDSAEFLADLHFAERQMEEYLDFLKSRAASVNKKKNRLSTQEIGIIKPEILKLSEDTYEVYKKTKDLIAKMKEVKVYERAKQILNYDTKKGSPSLILKNITDKNEDLQISFPVVIGKKCLKIIVCEGRENIKKSIFVMDDKMVKFEAKDLGRSARNDNAFNYYSQEEIDNSGLEDYLKVIKTRLEYMQKRFEADPKIRQ